VLAHCEGTSSTLASDSVAWFAGVKRFDMIGQKSPVHIRDTAMTLDAVNASYFLGQERLEAHKNVVTVNRKTGSVLRGPNLTYYRAVKVCATHSTCTHRVDQPSTTTRPRIPGAGSRTSSWPTGCASRGTTGCGAAGR